MLKVAPLAGIISLNPRAFLSFSKALALFVYKIIFKCKKKKARLKKKKKMRRIALGIVARQHGSGGGIGSGVARRGRVRFCASADSSSRSSSSADLLSSLKASTPSSKMDDVVDIVTDASLTPMNPAVARYYASQLDAQFGDRRGDESPGEKLMALLRSNVHLDANNDAEVHVDGGDDAWREVASRLEDLRGARTSASKPKDKRLLSTRALYLSNLQMMRTRRSQ